MYILAYIYRINLFGHWHSRQLALTTMLTHPMYNFHHPHQLMVMKFHPPLQFLVKKMSQFFRQQTLLLLLFIKSHQPAWLQSWIHSYLTTWGISLIYSLTSASTGWGNCLDTWKKVACKTAHGYKIASAGVTALTNQLSNLNLKHPIYVWPSTVNNSRRRSNKHLVVNKSMLHYVSYDKSASITKGRTKKAEHAAIFIIKM